MFHLFLSDESRQDDATITANINRLIELLKIKNKLMSTLGTIWKNNDGCAEQYRCVASATLPAKGIWVSMLLLGIYLLTLV